MREGTHGLAALTIGSWLGEFCSNPDFLAKAQQTIASLQKEKRELLQLQSQIVHRLKMFRLRPKSEHHETLAALEDRKQNIAVILKGIDMAISDIESYLSRHA